MNIVADENIPFAKEAFTDLGDVHTCSGRSLKNTDLANCDCLLVRSVTQVNRQLLENTPVKFVATATIGTDHIDLDYLQQNNIGFANAPGSNAESASEYVINALFELTNKKGSDPFKLIAGIIGCGNVGSRVKHKLEVLGIKTLVNDPPLQLRDPDKFDYVPIDEIFEQCNFITFHVPLTKSGNFSTWHLLDEIRLARLKPETILFNAARGSVIDNNALSELLKIRHDLTVFLDTWEGEPAINQTLLKQVDLATPHVAGYSFEGKLRGTQMILDAACNFFKQSSSWAMQQHLPQKEVIELSNYSNKKIWPELFSQHYTVEADHDRLLALAELSISDFAIEFDSLRKNYPRRYEYEQFKLHGINNKKAAAIARKLLFKVRLK